MNGARTWSVKPSMRTNGTPWPRSRSYRVMSAVVSACSPETKMMPETPRSTSISVSSSSVEPPGVWVASTGVYPCRVRACPMTWASAGKIGFSSSGVIRPTSPALRRRSRTGRS